MTERQHTGGHESLNTVMGVMNSWQRRVFEPHELTPQRRAERVSEEFVELEVALMTGDKKEILEESVDCILGLAGIALTVAEPQEVAAQVFDKLMVILRKYDPNSVSALKASGITTDMALEVRKVQWNRSNGKIPPSA